MLLIKEKAINTFNFLVAENRFAVAALIPSSFEEKGDLDVIRSLEMKELHNEDEDDKIKLEIGTEKRMQKVFEKAKELQKKIKLETGEMNKNMNDKK